MELIIYPVILFIAVAYPVVFIASSIILKNRFKYQRDFYHDNFDRISASFDVLSNAFDLLETSYQKLLLQVGTDWKDIAYAPTDKSIIWVANENNLVVAYFHLGAWRNWFKGCNYHTPFPPEAFAPDKIWFEPTKWCHIPKPPSLHEKEKVT